MNTKKFLIGGLTGGIAYFLLGYLFYGVLFLDFFTKNAGTATGVAKTMDQMIWWALILGNLIAGCLLAFVLGKAKTESMGSGLMTGACLGFLMAAAYDLTSYGTSNLMNSKGVIADVCIYTVMSAISGAIVGWVLGMLGKK